MAVAIPTVSEVLFPSQTTQQQRISKPSHKPLSWPSLPKSRFTILCNSTPTQPPLKPPPNLETPSLSDQLKPLSLTLLSPKTSAKPPPQILRKPKSIWLNPSRPRHSALSLQRHKRSPYSWNPHLKSLKLFAKKLSDCDLSDSAVSQTLSELPAPPTRENALLILNSLRSWQKTHLFFNWLKAQQDFPMETIFYNVTMKSLRNGKQWQLVEDLAHEMIQKGMQFDNITYSTIITCAKRCNLFDKAIEWFERMYQTGFMPDEVTYSAILDVYAMLGRVEEVLSLYERGRTSGWVPDAVAFSVLGKMFGEAGDYDGIQYVLREMRSLGVEPNLVVYNTLLEAMGKAGKPGLARSLFEEMVAAGLTPNEKTLTAMVKIYGKARWARDALDLWEQMKTNRWPMDFILYNTLLSMCADLGLEEDAERLFEDMRGSEHCKPDSWSYTAMLNIYSSGGNVEKANELFEELLGSGNKLNVMSSTCLIQCFGRAKRIDDAVRIFNVSMDREIVPDDRLCGCLLSVLTFCNEDEVSKVLDCLQKANPRLVKFVRLLGIEEVAFDEVREEFRGILNEAMVEVRRPFCNCLIDICCNLQFHERAHDLLYLGTLFGLYPCLCSKSMNEWSLNLRSLSLGAAYTAFAEWLRTLSKAIELQEALPQLFSIHTGVGNHKFSLGLGNSFGLHLKQLDAPFQQSEERAGWFIATQEQLVLWMQSRESSATVTA